MNEPLRTMYVWCPDWPVLAAGIVDGIPAHAPVAVLAANQVVACSEAARREGVRRGLRKREAQGRCPRLIVVDHDPGRDTRAFEPVVTAVEELAPGVAVVRPGACALAARGPARYFGSEESAAERIVERVAQAHAVEAQIGIADGMFAASLAARAGAIVPPGETTSFLAGFDISTVDRPALVDLLRRLGIATLGQFAALPAADVLARFGLDAAMAQRLAAGRDERPLAVRQPPPDLVVSQEFEPALERIDVAAFAARQLAVRLHDRLAGHGLACTRLGITAVTAHGEELHRTWRHDGLLSAAAIADRVRWQLDGWLSGTALPAPAFGSSGAARPDQPFGGSGTRQGWGRPSAGILRLSLAPDGLLAHTGLQLGLWGEVGVERDRAHRALVRVQGMLGPQAVVTAVLGGGRDPGAQATLVPWGDERAPDRPAVPPWPGRLGAPAPAAVPAEPLPAAVLDGTGAPVGVTSRLALTAAPAWLSVDEPAGLAAGQPAGRAAAGRIAAWAGPWPVDERWWAPAEASRRVRFQVCLADGRAMLLTLAGGDWSVTAIYD
jgi:protein ImuB